YAFLLHDLYHLKPDGIMAIVLPHGVLSRGGEEERIRKNLLENVDVIAAPSAPTTAYKIGANLSPTEMYLGDIYTLAVNLAGL
ncbi:N-6 DNA methylase, partial [Acinetobacter junii]|uniref:N-6 DNA methylase n=1 Tax=Acinetobacter junii TaxID=40215 RepID=UPI001C074AEF